MIEISELEEFVKPYYREKDMMHNLSHIKRMLKAAKKLAKNYEIDEELIIYGAYLHGIISTKKREIIEFLKSKKISKERIKRIIKAAEESHIKEKPESIEGKILHDAHLIEGGRTFLIVKSLITGALRNQSLKETIEYIEKNILGKYECYLPEAKKIYEEKERFAREFLKELKKDIQ